MRCARHNDWYDATIQAQVEQEQAGPLWDGARAAIERLVAMHAVDPDLRRALSPADRAIEAEATEGFGRILQDYLEARSADLRPLDAKLASYIAVRALEAVIHGTALDRPDLLRHPEFVDEATHLLVGYLAPVHVGTRRTVQSET